MEIDKTLLTISKELIPMFKERFKTELGEMELLDIVNSQFNLKEFVDEKKNIKLTNIGKFRYSESKSTFRAFRQELVELNFPKADINPICTQYTKLINMGYTDEETRDKLRILKLLP